MDEDKKTSSKGQKVATVAKSAASSRRFLTWLVVIVAIAAAVFFYHQNKQSQDKLKAAQASQNANQDLINAVSKLTVLPTGETPTIATVTDVTKLKGQAFFANAQNGDKVLIYTQAKKAILYRPSTNQIINIAPLNISASSKK